MIKTKDVSYLDLW